VPRSVQAGLVMLTIMLQGESTKTTTLPFGLIAPILMGPLLQAQEENDEL
jgi:hypothetical protein